MAQHYMVLCEKCDTVITQCRCPSQDKTKHYDTCQKCRDAANELKENEDEG